MIITKFSSWAARALVTALLMLECGNAFAVSINQCHNEYDRFNEVAHEYYGEEINENWNVLGNTGYVTLDWLNSLDDIEGMRGGRDGWQKRASSPSEATNDDDLRFEQLERTHIVLLLCLYDHRIAEVEAEAQGQNTIEAAEAEPAGGEDGEVGICSTTTTQTLNERLAGIDARVQRFLETPLAKREGTATPMLQVVMWATDEQRDLIGALCADQPAYRRRMQELDASYDAALKACQQIQSRPLVCGPSSPENVLAANPLADDEPPRNENRSTAAASADARLAVSCDEIPGDWGSDLSGEVSYDPVTGLCLITEGALEARASAGVPKSGSQDSSGSRQCGRICTAN